MSSVILPYRADGRPQGPQDPSSREMFVREALRKKFQVKDPQAWIAAQAQADKPEFLGWRYLWSAHPLDIWNDRPAAVGLLREYGQSLDSKVLKDHLNALNLLASVLDPGASSIYRDWSHTGMFMIIGDGLELIHFKTGYFPQNDTPVSGTESFVGVSFSAFSAANYYNLVQATVLRVWDEEAGERSKKAREMLCRPYAYIIAQAAEDAEEDYERSLIAQGKLDFGPAPAVENAWPVELSHAIIYENDRGVITAEIFPADKFPPEKFRDSEVHYLELSGRALHQLLYGYERRFLFQRRILDDLIRSTLKHGQKILLVSVKAGDDGSLAHVLIADRNALKGVMPTGEPILSPTA